MRQFDIPGGTASFREREELSAAGSRAIAKATRHLPKRAIQPEAGDGKHAEGSAVEPEVETDLLGFPVDLTDDELDAVWEFNDVMILATLDSWSIDRPLPRSRDDVGALPGPLYGALQKAIAELQKTNSGDGEPVDEFGPDAVDVLGPDGEPDKTLPTGA